MGARAKIAIPTGTFTKKIASQPMILDQDAAEQDAGRRAAARDGAPDPECLVALGLVVAERVADDRQRRRRDDRAAEALNRPEDDQLRPAVGEPAGEEPPVNSTIPNMNTLRRPRRSAERPPRSRKPPNASE